jgi:hypothetical protein
MGWAEMERRERSLCGGVLSHAPRPYRARRPLGGPARVEPSLVGTNSSSARPGRSRRYLPTMRLPSGTFSHGRKRRARASLVGWWGGGCGPPPPPPRSRAPPGGPRAALRRDRCVCPSGSRATVSRPTWVPPCVPSTLAGSWAGTRLPRCPRRTAAERSACLPRMHVNTNGEDRERATTAPCAAARDAAHRHPPCCHAVPITPERCPPPCRRIPDGWHLLALRSTRNRLRKAVQDIWAMTRSGNQVRVLGPAHASATGFRTS